MKGQLKVAVSLLYVAAIIAGSGAQSAPQGQDHMQETQARDVWTDPSTGLMWTDKDNGKDVTWKKAMKYCRDLRLAEYSDWRLPTIAELEQIYDSSANAPGRDGQGDSTWHVRGNLFLTGNQWSSTRVIGYGARPSGYASRFDFNEGRVFDGDELSFHTFKRALCVHVSGK